MFKGEGLKPGAFKLWVNGVQRAPPHHVCSPEVAADGELGVTRLAPRFRAPGHALCFTTRKRLHFSREDDGERHPRLVQPLAARRSYRTVHAPAACLL
jgi:hypothetical protein